MFFMKSLSCMPCFSVGSLGVSFGRIFTTLSHPILSVIVDVARKNSHAKIGGDDRASGVRRRESSRTGESERCDITCAQ